MEGSKLGANLDSPEVSKAVVVEYLDEMLELVVTMMLESETGKSAGGSFDCVLEFAAYYQGMVEIVVMEKLCNLVQQFLKKTVHAASSARKLSRYV